MKFLNVILVAALMLGTLVSFGQKLKMNTNTNTKLKTATLKKGTALSLKSQIPVFKSTKALTEQAAQAQEFKLPETTTKIMTFKKADEKTSTAPSSSTTAAKRSNLSARSMYSNRNYLTSNGTTDGLRGVIHLKKGQYSYRRKVNGSWRTFRHFNNDYVALTNYLTTRTALITVKITNIGASATNIKVSSGGNTHLYTIAKNQTKEVQFIVSPTRRGYYRSYIHIDGDANQRVSVKNVVVQEL